MKNVALCYSGQIRDFKKCFESHVKHIIDANPEYNFYIFFHSWSDKSLEGKSHFGERTDRGFYKAKNVSEILDINPDSFLLEKPIAFKSDLIPDPRFPHPIENTLSMFYSIMMANNLKILFSQARNVNFDWSVRLRTDLFFTKDFKIDDYNPENMYINDQFVHTEYAVNDLFSFSNSKDMDVYSQTFVRIESMVENGCAVNPECFLGFSLHSSDLFNIKKTPLQNHYYKLFRDL